MSSIEKVVELLKKTSQEGITTEQLNVQAGHETSGSNRSIERLNIDFKYFQENGIITPATMDGVKAEEFRALKRPLLRNAFGKKAIAVENGNMIMVTSSLPEEGKTFTALSLAMSIALEKDTTVLLIDADVLNPSLSRFLNIQENVGLTEYLQDPDIELGNIIINTDLENLRVLSAGSRHSESTELLASERMERLIKELSERYSDRVVLFDSPPLLLTSQAIVLSHLMGQIIVVIEAEKTPKSVVKEAVELLDSDQTIGLVLNKTKKFSRNSYYGTYYGSQES